MTAPTVKFPRAVPRWRIVWAALAGLVAGMVLWPVYSGFRLPVTSIDGSGPTPHTVTVSGAGRVFVAPDMAEVRLGVLVQRSTVAEVRTEAARAAEAVVAALREVGIPGADIQTSMLTLQPVYEYRADGGTPRIVAYELRNGLTVSVRDLDLIGPAVDKALAAGATTLDGITLEVVDQTAAERQARERAVRDARAKADALVNATGARIDDVVSITESVSSPPWPWRGEAPVDDKGTPIMPGVNEVIVNVTIVYGIS
jgi:hypothetical protein